VQPSRDGLYFDKYLEKALRIVRRQMSKGKGQRGNDDDDDRKSDHRHNDD
jgi:hypothetical protein